MSSYAERLIGAAKLDVAIYEEVEADTRATGMAMATVALVAVAAGIGSAQFGVTVLLGGIIVQLVAWFIWAFLTFIIGTKLLPEAGTDCTLDQMLRTLGFAAAPGLLLALAFIPLVGSLLRIIVPFWMLATMVIAVRQALDYQSTWRAIGVCLIGWLINLLVIGSFMAMVASRGGSF